MKQTNLIKLGKYVLLLSCSLCAYAHPFAPEDGNSQPRILKIASHQLIPYHWLNQNGAFEGPALTPLKCILSELEQEFEIEIFPWARAQELVRHQYFDAFFITSSNSNRDAYAKFSRPFLFDSWNFYYHPDHTYSLTEADIKEKYLGVLSGSNMEHWAKKNGFANRMSFRDYGHLFKILKLSRLDIVMATERIYSAQMEQLGWNKTEFASEKVRDLDMGIYFGNHFLEAYPTYLERFNHATSVCLEQ